jgi:hypothetical protein
VIIVGFMKDKSIKICLILALVLSSIPVGYASANPAPEMKVHYKFDEVNGVTAVNSGASGAAFDGTLQPGSSWTTGVHTGAVQLNGTSGYVKLPDGVISDLDEITISTWVKLDTKKVWQTMYTFASNDNSKYMILTSQGNPGNSPVGLSLVMNNGSGEQRISVGKGKELPSQIWKHVVFTLSGSTVKLYVDGELAATKTNFTIKPSDLGVTQKNYIGKSIYNDPLLGGLVDDFRIYGSALGAGDIKQMYNEGILPDNLFVKYNFDDLNGTSVANSGPGGASMNAVLHNGSSWSEGLVNGAIELNGTDGYVKMPDGVLSQADDVTISSWFKLDAKKNWQTLYAFAEGQSKYILLSSQGVPGNSPVGVTLSIKNATGGEERISVGAGKELPSGVWKHVAFTLNGRTGKLYIDGILMATKTDFTIKPSDLGVTTNNFIGKSVFSDPNLDGKVDDFRIYNRALREAEIATLVLDGNLAMVNADRMALSLGDLSAVKSDLVLPLVGTNGSTIAWSSDKPSFVNSQGKVQLPARGQSNETVTLIATLKKGSSELTQSFEVTVVSLTDQIAVQKAVDRMSIPVNINHGSKLPISAAYGTTVSWTTADPHVTINEEGVVSADFTGAVDKRISATVTAVVSLGEEQSSRTFVVTFIAPFAGYILSYFGGSPYKESLFMGYSYDGVHWVPLKGNTPILNATLGSKSVRDPFLMRKKDGSFAVIATQGWDNPSLYIWDSENLTSFSNERLVKVSNFGPRAWAPEASYDILTDKYIFYWSDPAVGPIYSNTSSDLIQFTDPEEFFSTGYSIIDATITDWNNEYYLFFKDERDSGKSIKTAKSSSLAPGSFKVITPNFITDTMVEGPFALKSLTQDQWYLYYDYFNEGGKFGVSVSSDLNAETWTKLAVDQFNLPAGVRHGGSIPVTQEELSAILTQWGAPDLNIIQVKPITDVLAPVGTSFGELSLPATVEVLLGDGSVRSLDVTWGQGGYDESATGVNTLTGAIMIPAGITNTSGSSASIKVIVSASDKLALQTAITQANALTASDYTSSTWGVLEPALVQAEAVYLEGNATQLEVDEATEELIEAINGLELKPVLPDPVIKTALLAVIDQAKLLNAVLYTSMSWAVLQQALVQAELVYSFDGATQSEVDLVRSSLLTAIAGLQLEQVTPPVTPVTPQPPIDPKSPVLTVENGVAFVKVADKETSVTIPVSELASFHLQIQFSGIKIAIDSQLLVDLIAQAGDAAKKNASIIVQMNPSQQPTNIAPVSETEAVRLKVGSETFDIRVLLKTQDSEEIQLENVQGGVEIELPYKEGQALDESLLAIHYYNKTTNKWEYVGGKVDTEKKTVKVKLQHLSRYAVLAYEHGFNDVATTHWVSSALSVLTVKQIVLGSENGQFKPSRQTTRAEFTAMLVRALKLSADKPINRFSDVKSTVWYAEDVAAAYAAGLIKGVTETEFKPDAYISREQMAVLIVRAWTYKLNSADTNSNLLNGYVDGASVSPWAQQAVNQAINSGLMKGKTGSKFDPASQVQRAEVAQAIYNLIKRIE